MKQFNIFKTPQRVWGKDVHGELPPRTKLPPEKIRSSHHQKHKRQLKKMTKVEREKIRIGKFFSQGDFPGSIFFLKAVSPGDFFIEPPQRLILILIVHMYQPLWYHARDCEGLDIQMIIGAFQLRTSYVQRSSLTKWVLRFNTLFNCFACDLLIVHAHLWSLEFMVSKNVLHVTIKITDLIQRWSFSIIVTTYEIFYRKF